MSNSDGSRQSVAVVDGFAKPEGMARVREVEWMSLAQLAAEALRQAERLADVVYQEAFQVHVKGLRADVFGSEGRSLDRAGEVLALTQTADHYLMMLQDVLRTESAGNASSS